MTDTKSSRRIRKLMNSRIFLFNDLIDRYDKVNDDDNLKIKYQVLKRIKPLPSLPQFSNTCFFDASMNLLSSIVAFRKYCIETKDKGDYLVQNLKILIAERFTIMAYVETLHKNVINALFSLNKAKLKYGDSSHSNAVIKRVLNLLNSDESIVKYVDLNIDLDKISKPDYIIQDINYTRVRNYTDWVCVGIIYQQAYLYNSIPVNLEKDGHYLTFSVYADFYIDSYRKRIFTKTKLNQREIICDQLNQKYMDSNEPLDESDRYYINSYHTKSKDRYDFYILDIYIIVEICDEKVTVNRFGPPSGGHFIVHFPYHNVVLESFLAKNGGTYYIPHNFTFYYHPFIDNMTLYTPVIALYMRI